MSRVVRVALAQDNLPVGDLSGNVRRARARLDQAQRYGADLIIFPELSVTGYPPEDLLLKKDFVNSAADAIDELASAVSNITALVGYPMITADTNSLHNTAAVLINGKIAAQYRKHHLPNYAVFDERRYFTAGNEAVVINIGDCLVGVTICEDIWMHSGPLKWAALDGGAELIVNLSASPYHMYKGTEREQRFATQCITHRCFLAFCNAVGGQDELVFDGHSLVIDPNGVVIARGAQFTEDLIIVDVDLAEATTLRRGDKRWTEAKPKSDRIVLTQGPRPSSSSTAPVANTRTLEPVLSPEAEVYAALSLGTRDYVKKNGFRGGVLGLSGGIDSALTLTVAVDALGSDAVTAVSMPSEFTADISREDARELASSLNVSLLELSIKELALTYESCLQGAFADTEPNVAEENLQARIRGNLLMALSNKFGWLVLTTGNKSELSVGYATLYGDMAGGFAILKDVFKTCVYKLARWRNRDAPVIPQRIIDRPPTAELRKQQLDSDSLPPYDVLDGILERYVERDEHPTQIEASGFDPATVRRVIGLVDRAEYKRRQAPPGIRISTRAFGKDRRLPITNLYRP
ncbi:MAG TPA: NAD+ synthase [Acidobacteria bacterium]|nr:NAD+ synthase [Acidobacteriota bacterium]